MDTILFFFMGFSTQMTKNIRDSSSVCLTKFSKSVFLDFIRIGLVFRHPFTSVRIQLYDQRNHGLRGKYLKGSGYGASAEP